MRNAGPGRSSAVKVSPSSQRGRVALPSCSLASRDTLLTEWNSADSLPLLCAEGRDRRGPARRGSKSPARCTTSSHGGWNAGTSWPMARTATASSRGSGSPRPRRRSSPGSPHRGLRKRSRQRSGEKSTESTTSGIMFARHQRNAQPPFESHPPVHPRVKERSAYRDRVEGLCGRLMEIRPSYSWVWGPKCFPGWFGR